MTLELSALAAAMHGAVVPRPAAGQPVQGYSIDSRTLAPGDLFFALSGPTHDGHDHVEAALRQGALAAVVRHAWPQSPDGPLIRVDDTLNALQAAGRHARAALPGTVIAVTGSAGKTTTKDVIAHLLGVAMPVGKTVGNLNNHIGVPLSLLRLPPDTRAAVLEMGMNHAGEIRSLCEIARPGIGVVTNVGYAHVENFNGIEGVAAAKRELIESLPPDGTAVLNADDPLVARFREHHAGRSVSFGLADDATVRATNVALTPAGATFNVEDVTFHSPFAGRHGVRNILAGVAVARLFGVPLHRLAEATATLTVGSMRGERIERDGVTLWNDTYNANPDAMRAMLEVLADTSAERRVAVLGEMRELGAWSERLHREVGTCAARSGVTLLLAVAGDARHLAEAAVEAGLPPDAVHFRADATEAGRLLRELARPGDVVLLKGSRGTRVERALEAYLG